MGVIANIISNNEIVLMNKSFKIFSISTFVRAAKVRRRAIEIPTNDEGSTVGSKRVKKIFADLSVRMSDRWRGIIVRTEQ